MKNISQQTRHKADPTPAEIRAACLAIQTTWSASTREARRHGPKGTARPEALTWQPRVITPIQRIDFVETN